MTTGSNGVGLVYSAPGTGIETTVPSETLLYWRGDTTTLASQPPYSGPRGLFKFFKFFPLLPMLAGTLLGTTLVSEPASQPATAVAPVRGDTVPVTGEIKQAWEEIRDRAGLSQDKTAQLLGLAGRQTLRGWVPGGRIRRTNLSRLLEIRALIRELHARVPDLKLFLLNPPKLGWSTPFELIARGQDDAVLGMALIKPSEQDDEWKTRRPIIRQGPGTVDLFYPDE